MMAYPPIPLAPPAPIFLSSCVIDFTGIDNAIVLGHNMPHDDSPTSVYGEAFHEFPTVDHFSLKMLAPLPPAS